MADRPQPAKVPKKAKIEAPKGQTINPPLQKPEANQDAKHPAPPTGAWVNPPKLEAKLPFKEIGCAIGDILSILDGFDYGKRLLIMKSVAGAVGFAPRPAQPKESGSSTAGAEAPKKQKKKVKTDSHAKHEPKSDLEEKKAPPATSEKKRKRVAPPPPNPANQDPTVKALKVSLNETLEKIKSEAKKAGVKHLSLSHELIRIRDRKLNELTVAKGRFRAFDNMSIDADMGSGGEEETKSPLPVESKGRDLSFPKFKSKK